MSQFMVGTDAVQAAGNKIQSLSQQIEDLITTCMQTAEGVKDNWTGQANTAFEGAMTEWRQAAMNVREASGQIGKATMTASSNYVDTEQANTSMFT